MRKFLFRKNFMEDILNKEYAGYLTDYWVLLATDIVKLDNL